ncbi:hypothetical protein MIND_00073700 [Mycena indigotica]|uniref:Uncharacterized protein n=1 Tax=Mycena indigotica TaxID=2126181 RepID=A0A8H6TBP8_9AGAR|nr:uncharacterized protein MIND_00073700 [Mycena indigotica]KAF7315583.1 hypothetical protein MIND_00073700 [Mycena indigotica]
MTSRSRVPSSRLRKAQPIQPLYSNIDATSAFNNIRGHSSTVSLTLSPTEPFFADHELEWISISVDGHNRVSDSPEPPDERTSDVASENLDEFKRKLAKATTMPQMPFNSSSLSLSEVPTVNSNLRRSLSTTATTPAWPRVLNILDSLKPSSREPTAAPLLPRRRPTLLGLPRRRLSKSASQGKHHDDHSQFSASDLPVQIPSGLARIDSRSSVASSIAFAPTATIQHQRRVSSDSVQPAKRDSLLFAPTKLPRHQRVVDLDVDLELDNNATDSNPIYRLQATTTDASILHYDDDDTTPPRSSIRDSVDSVASLAFARNLVGRHQRTVDMDVEPIESLDNPVYRLQAATEVPVVYHESASEELLDPEDDFDFLETRTTKRGGGGGASKLARTLGTDDWRPSVSSSLPPEPSSFAAKRVRRLSISSFLPSSRPSSPPLPPSHSLPPAAAAARRKASWGSFTALMQLGPRKEGVEPAMPSPRPFSEFDPRSDSSHLGHGRRHSVASSVTVQGHLDNDNASPRDMWFDDDSGSSTPLAQTRQPSAVTFDEYGYESTFATLFQPTIIRTEEVELEWAGEWNRKDMRTVLDALRRL